MTKELPLLIEKHRHTLIRTNENNCGRDTEIYIEQTNGSFFI